MPDGSQGSGEGAEGASLVANARMYAVTPAAEARWREVFRAVAQLADVPLRYETYSAPKPLEGLWNRDDLGLAFMCGWPFARTYTTVQPIAAPVPTRFGRPVYATDFVVRTNSPARTLADTFGGRIGWTVEHSQSGFNAPRSHLLARRTPGRPRLYRESVGSLVTARRVVDAVIAGDIDVGPLDAYWHELLGRHAPEIASQIRTVETTEPTPAPLLVAAPRVDAAIVGRLRDALTSIDPAGPLGPALDDLCLAGFAPASRDAYRVQLSQAREAEAAGYREPG